MLKLFHLYKHNSVTVALLQQKNQQNRGESSVLLLKKLLVFTMSPTLPENRGLLSLRHIKPSAASSSRVNLQQDVFSDKYYVSQIKVILIAMKYIGILPITIPKSGK
jgi:hypothetical protein